MDIVKSVLQPSGLLLLFLTTALVCWFYSHQLAFGLVVVATVSLYLLSIGVIANALLRGLEHDIKPLSSRSTMTAQAIVVLGCDVSEKTPEYGNEPQPGAFLLQRLRYATLLAKQTHLPILVSGGTFHGINEAEVMQRFLEKQDSPATWMEVDSLSTWENARYSADILKKENISRILLVSHASHLKRACYAFSAAGLDCLPAPTAFKEKRRSLGSLSGWLPNTEELYKSNLALKEYMGLAWYRLHYKVYGRTRL